MKLIKPAIHPKCIEDESPVGYLHRLAKLNHFGLFDWLIKDVNRNIKLPELYELLNKNEWTGFNSHHPFSELNGLSYIYAQSSKIALCPLCLNDSGYWNYKAHVVLNPICVKHRCWKKDSCSKCKKNFSWREGSLNSCSCSAIRFDLPETPPQNVIELASFLEGELREQSTRLVSSEFTYKSRCDLFMLFARNINLRGRLPRFNSIAVAKEYWGAVADLLLGDTILFNQFLKDLYTRKPEDFKYFYRKLHTFNQSSLQHHKDMVMAFIIRELRTPITNRHRSLIKDKPESEIWLSLQTVSRQFSIPKSTLRQLMDHGKIQYENRMRKRGVFTVIYIKSPQEFQILVDNYLNFQSAAILLGVTLAQLRLIIEQGFLKDVMRPDGEYLQWIISSEEIILLKARLHVNYKPRLDTKISISDAVSFYSVGFDSLLTNIFNAIIDGQVTVIESTKEQHVRNMYLDKEEFLEWRKQRLTKSDKISIVDLARRFEINQESMYQIVNAGLIKAGDCGKNRLNRYISESDIAEFKEKYALLSKMAWALRKCPKNLKAELEWYGANPIDEALGIELRQTIYSRSELIKKCIHLGYLLEKKGDWSFEKNQI